MTTKALPTPYLLWDPNQPFPSHEEMLDLDYATHVMVERAVQGGYHYLHETRIAWYHDILYVCWANHRIRETNKKGELIRGKHSADGGRTWSPAEVWAAPPQNGAESYNIPTLAVHEDRLWGFFTRWDNEEPSTELFTMDDVSGRWQTLGRRIPGFIPFRPPMRMADGNWIISGELSWTQAAVAISHGHDFTTWDVVPIRHPEDMVLRFPETTLMKQDHALLAICRTIEAPTAPVAESRDGGRTWTLLQSSNFPMRAQPFCGELSTGQHYLITNNLEAGRTLLSIAVTRPGGVIFERIWKIRHQPFPRRRLLNASQTAPGSLTQWSYPSAVEHGGNLYVSYTHAKQDCGLSIIPLEALQVRDT